MCGLNILWSLVSGNCTLLGGYTYSKLDYRVFERDCELYFFSDGPKKFEKCYNPMIFRERIQGGFGIWIFQKCQVHGILPFGVVPIQGISCTMHGLNTHIHPQTHPNPTNIHTLHLYALRHLLQVSQDKSGQQQTPSDSNRHQTTPTDFPRHPKRPFKDVRRFVLTWNGVCWCLLVSYVVWRCEEGV